MSNETNVTHWIARLANPEHESEAARKIWDHCIDRLVLEASRRLRSFERPALVSPDDVAVSAFANFWQKAKQGKFPDLKDRDSLLGLLLRMTQQKAFDHVRYWRRQRRQDQGQSVLKDPDGETRDVCDFLGDSPSPQSIAIMTEQFQRILQLLDDPSLPEGLSELALLKLKNYSNGEIAAELGWSLRKVERRVAIMKKTLKNDPEISRSWGDTNPPGESRDSEAAAPRNSE